MELDFLVEKGKEERLEDQVTYILMLTNLYLSAVIFYTEETPRNRYQLPFG
jgi:hypothetical protein